MKLENLSINAGVLIYAIVWLCVVGLGITWAVIQWHECRAMGFSFLYCVQHIL